MKKIVKRGEMCPPFYGVAWVDYVQDQAVCYPLPLNRIVALLRDFFLWLRFGHIAKTANPREAYLAGLLTGLESRQTPKGDK
jgi:hypothetical protein